MHLSGILSLMVKSDSAVLAWTRLVRAQTAAMGAIEGALKQAGLPSLEWYDVLLELERGGPLRPRDLQARLLLAQYNLSRLLDRMVDARLVERLPCEQDGRGYVLMITREGRAMRRRMWPIYAAAIEEAVGARLTAREAEQLAALLEKLIDTD